MLILKRRASQSVAITIGGVRVWVRVLDIDLRGNVKLGFDAPAEVQVNREEIQAELDAIAAGRLLDSK